MAKVFFAKNSRRLLGQYCAFGRGFINISAKKKTRPQYIVVGNLWQGRRDSNTQPTVLETATLPLSHSPKALNII